MQWNRKSRKQFHRSLPVDTSGSEVAGDRPVPSRIILAPRDRPPWPGVAGRRRIVTETAGSGVAGDRPVPSRRAVEVLRHPPPHRGRVNLLRLPEWTIISPAPTPPEPSEKLVRGGLGGYPRTPQEPPRTRRQGQRLSGTNLFVGSGLALTSEGKITTDGAFEVDPPLSMVLADGVTTVSLDLATDPCLEVSADELRVKVKTAGGVLRHADGLVLDTTLVPRMYSALVGDGVATVYAIPQATHGTGSTGRLLVQVYLVSTGILQAAADPTIGVNNATGEVTLTFGVAPASNAYRVVILG